MVFRTTYPVKSKFINSGYIYSQNCLHEEFRTSFLSQGTCLPSSEETRWNLEWWQNLVLHKTTVIWAKERLAEAWALSAVAVQMVGILNCLPVSISSGKQ